MSRTIIQTVVVFTAISMTISSGWCAEASGGIWPSYLRCEYLADPLGIDIPQPRLSWELQSSDPDARMQKQTAYQVLAASSLDLLNSGQGDLWDSGKTASDRTSQVVYEGKALESNKDCWWKVRVWDQDDKASDWSRPARWSSGLLQPQDWKGQWIEKPFRTTFERCKWIWNPEGDARSSAPEGTYYFRRRFHLDAPSQAAVFLITADDSFVLYIDGKEIGKSEDGADSWKKPQFIDIGSPGAGDHAAAVVAVNEKASPAGLTGKLMILADNHQLVIPIDETWKVSTQEADGWKTPGFDDAAWKNARVFAAVGEDGTPWGVPGDEDGLILPPPPYFQKEFRVDKPVKRAFVYATAQGVYELRLNSERVGEDYFAPGWSDYRKRLYYNAYDVTCQLRQGENAVGAILSDGWFAGYVAWGRIRNRYAGEPKLRAQINIEYADGTSEIVGTDSSWMAIHQGPIQEADFLMGEVYDARKELKDWATPDFAWKRGDSPYVLGSDWSSAALSTPAKEMEIELNAYPGVTVKKITEFPAKTIAEPQPGVFVFDLGQNLVGWARLRVQGPAGTKVQLRFAEVLNPDGTLYVTNLRAARVIDAYILKGEGVEVWEPSFTFHGFRYVELTGYPGHPPLDAVTGVALHSDIAPAGTFECSNGMVNQLIHNIEWGMRGNYLEIPTDCPQRDERLGWMGDAQIFMRTGTYNKDIASFFTKWIQDVVDSQRPDGSFTDVSPDVGLGSGVAAWADAGIVCPYTMYLVYGDTRILEKHYSAMQKYIEYLKKSCKDLIRPAFGYGDWLSLNADTPKDLLATAYFAYSTSLMREIASAIGREDDAKEYEALYQDIRAAFAKAFVKGDGQVQDNTQTGYVLALRSGLIPEDKIPAAMRHLIRDLMVRDYHFSTGFAGLKDLLPTLTRNGRIDIAYKLLLNDTFPSWGYEIKNGATTIWERWDGWTDEFGFQDPGMNSFNHYAYGAVGEWLYSTVAGIDADAPGYQRIVIHPQLGGDLDYVKASYRSISGWIDSECRLADDKLQLNVRIPANTEAMIFVPAKEADGVTESGKPAADSLGVSFVDWKDSAAIYHVRSGKYSFAANR